MRMRIFIFLALTAGPLYFLLAETTPAPYEWNTPNADLNLAPINSTESDSTVFESFSFSKEQPDPETEVRPATVEKATESSVVWWILGGSTIVVLLLGILIWHLYYDNAFGMHYKFKEINVSPRLGGRYSGGLGAVVQMKTGEPVSRDL